MLCEMFSLLVYLKEVKMFDFEIKKMLEVTEESDQTFFKMDCIPDRYVINKKGLIFDELHKRDVYPSFDNGYLRVTLNIDGKFIKFDLRKLILMAFSPMHTTPQVYTNQLLALSFDKNLCNLNLDNLIWRIPLSGVECLKYPGFYSIVGNPEVVISKKGVILDYHTGKEKHVTIPTASDKYPIIGNDTHYNGIKLPFTARIVHRLVAYAFLPIEGSRDRFYVNHIDGNKLNYDIKNLEWVTYKENRDHAVETGLCVQSVRLMAIDIYTGERRKFPSLQAAARGLNIHAWDISRAIEAYRGQGKIICPPWLFLEEGDTIPTSFIKIQKRVDPMGFRWFLVEKDGVSEYVQGVKNLFSHVKAKRDVIVGTKVFYNSFEVNGYKVKEVYRQDVPVEEYKKEDSRGGKVQKAIRVTDLSSGSVTTYPSTDEFAALVGAKRKTIQRGMLYNDSVWYNFKIEYVN